MSQSTNQRKVSEPTKKKKQKIPFDIIKLVTLFINLKILAKLKLFPQGPYLAWQITDDSKKTIIDQVPKEYQVVVAEFLKDHGHVTIAGNFGAPNRKAYGGIGAVGGTLDVYPDLKTKLIAAEDQEPTILILKKILIANDGEVICATIDSNDDQVVLREKLPTDQGISEDFLKGKSHITLFVDSTKGRKPFESNLVLQAFDLM